MDWTEKIKQEPKESDGQIIVTNGNGFFEIVWKSEEDGEYKKPCRYDEYDFAAFKDGDFTHWMKIENP